MSQPITVYRVADGVEETFYAPRYVAELVAAGLYSYDPVTVEPPAAPVPALTEDEPATEKESAAPKPQAPARPRRKGQAL